MDFENHSLKIVDHWAEAMLQQAGHAKDCYLVIIAACLIHVWPLKLPHTSKFQGHIPMHSWLIFQSMLQDLASRQHLGFFKENMQFYLISHGCS